MEIRYGKRRLVEIRRIVKMNCGGEKILE